MSQNLTASFVFALLFTSLSIALLHQVPTQLLSLFQVLILCILLSTLSPHFSTHILHCYWCCYFSLSTTSYQYSSFYSFTPLLSHNVLYLLSQALLSKKLLYPATIKKEVFQESLAIFKPMEKAEEHSLVLVFNTVLLLPLNQHFMPTALMGKWNANKIQPKINELSRGLDTSTDTLTPRPLKKSTGFALPGHLSRHGTHCYANRELFSWLRKYN